MQRLKQTKTLLKQYSFIEYKMKRYSFFMLALFLSCCTEKELTKNEIYEKCSSGVALVKVEYYAVFKMSDGAEIYGAEDVVGLDKSTFKPAVKYGTGFFVGDNGELITNRHVVEVDFSNSKLMVCNIIKSLIKINEENLQQGNDAISAIGNATYSTQEECDYLMGVYQSATFRRDSILNVISYLKSAKIEATEPYVKVSIGYKSLEFQPSCVVKKSSTVDLALVQLESRVTPSSAYIFKIPEKDMEYNKLYMIGYNYGTELASTMNGLMPQITEGTVSQNIDNTKILYSIPALPGSSGSPVINQYGELVAINFAGISNTQSFNYGIKVNNLRDLMP